MPNEQERARRREYMRAYRSNQSDSVLKLEPEKARKWPDDDFKKKQKE